MSNLKTIMKTVYVLDVHKSMILMFILKENDSIIREFFNFNNFYRIYALQNPNVWIMQYIMMSYFKRIKCQQTFSGLFEAIRGEMIELDLVSRILLFNKGTYRSEKWDALVRFYWIAKTAFQVWSDNGTLFKMLLDRLINTEV